MTDSPYADQPGRAFWRSAVAETSPLDLQGIYQRRWPIEPDWKIATAGSCFAQHIARYMKAADYSFTMMRNLHVDGWRRAKRRQTESLETLTSPPEIPPTQENHVELNRLLAPAIVSSFAPPD